MQWGQHRALPGDDDMAQAFDDLVRDRFILGDPGECARAEVTGATTMLFRIHWPGMPHEVITRRYGFWLRRCSRSWLGAAPAAAHPASLAG